MTTEPRTIGLFDGREVVVIYGHHTHPEREAPIGLRDVDPLPPPGTVVVGRLDNAPALLARRLTACKLRVSVRDHADQLYMRDYALPMSLEQLDDAVGHLVAELVAAMLDVTPAHTVKEHTA